AKGNGLIGAYASTFFLTLTNPMTILSFAAIFAGLGVASTSGSYVSAGVLVLGVFSGSAFWWLLLSGGVAVFRAKFNLRALKWVNRISGILIMLFGLYVLLGIKLS
ncbi:MAG: LysE family transporter, partial [Deltaproteobacteria bacterium]|nr:LysE family transporter [Deltaproteobacteria bacterium]